MWYQQSSDEIIRKLKTDAVKGLTQSQVQKRLSKFGPNTLPVKPPQPIIFKFLNQFKSVLILVLLGATILSAAVGDLLDAFAILIIVLLNAAIGTIQEAKAQKTLENLKSADIPYTFVLRDGTTEKVKVEEIVAGDILILEAGEKVPADCRVIESYQLSVDESILTGESLSVAKNSKPLTQSDIALGDQINMAFKNTQVTAGRGKAIVVETGLNTQMGKIAQSLEETTVEKTPLTIQLDKVGKMLTIVIVIIAAVVFIITGIRGMPFVERLLIAIALSVAAIPEGLPAIATITLALGVERLAKKNTIVKKMHAVETLGSIHIIATDKTGTITENKMNVTDIFTADSQTITVESEGYSIAGTIKNSSGSQIDPPKNKNLIRLLYCAILANNASLKKSENAFQILGDSTEGALLIAGQRAGIAVSRLSKEFVRIFEIPFSESTKMMSVICKIGDSAEAYLFSKGAPEEILKVTSLSPQKKEEVIKKVKEYANKGLRVLGFAEKKLPKKDLSIIVEKSTFDSSNMEFLGLIAQKDTLRLDIKAALQKARTAGIKTIMITGDHAQTATNIGLEAGIIDSPSEVATEKTIEKLSARVIARLITEGKFKIFARTSPLGKLKIIKSLKLIPYLNVAVTGDGVNDAPALKASHVGIAMGSGTDLAKEVSDLVIADDNYATIIEAIKEGRIIYANLIKFIRYLISCNLAEVFVVVLAVVFNTPLPLLPIQLLWINLITDGLPALALGNDPPEYDVMLRHPRGENQILHARRWSFMVSEGLVIGISVFLLYLYALLNFSQSIAQTMAFTALAASQLIHALNNRSTRTSVFKLGIFSNTYLLIAIAVSLLLQYLAVSTILGQTLFKTTALNPSQWGIIAVVAFLPLLFVELKKAGLKKLRI